MYCIYVIWWKHSELKCPISFGNLKMVQRQNFFFSSRLKLLSWPLIIQSKKCIFFFTSPFLGSMKWPHFDDFDNIYCFYVKNLIVFPLHWWTLVDDFSLFPCDIETNDHYFIHFQLLANLPYSTSLISWICVTKMKISNS